MKKILYFLIVTFVIGVTSCEDELDTKNMFSQNSQSYYKNPQQMQEALAGVYNALYVDNHLSDEHLVAELLSDVVFAGGGSDDVDAKSLASFVDPKEDTHKSLWVQTYAGIARANAILEAAQNNDYSNSFDTQELATEFKNKMLAEAYFMRGFLYFRAARFFGGMPLVLKTTGPFDVERATIPQTYGQIASDFSKAAELFPDKNIKDIGTSEYGHANLWVAKAYLARTYLYFTGYMTNIVKAATDVVPMPDGKSLTKAQVIAHLEDIQSKSGYLLTPDFRNLWPYAQMNTQAKKDILPWATTNNLAWVGQDGPNATKFGTGNKEVMFALRYTNSTWALGEKYRNYFVLFCGVRKNSMIPFGEGWGWGTVHSKFYSDWSNNDTRKDGSVLVMGDAAQGTDTYSPNQGDHETGLFIKKYTPLQLEENGVKTGLFKSMYGTGEDYMLWQAQDFYYLRYSDVLLMHSELTGTATGLNAVRQRAYGANHTDIAYSIDALKAERLHEFAFEGVRWFDLVRWGDVIGTNTYFGVEADVVNEGKAAKHSETYRAETKGLRPVPESEVTLSNGVYKQNPGW